MCNVQPMGKTLRLDANLASLQFADGSMDNLHTRFYRSKLTTWMAHQEENYRFILLEVDPSRHPHWTQICVSQVRSPLGFTSTLNPKP